MYTLFYVRLNFLFEDELELKVSSYNVLKINFTVSDLIVVLNEKKEKLATFYQLPSYSNTYLQYFKMETIRNVQAIQFNSSNSSMLGSVGP